MVKEAVPFGERLAIISGCPLFQTLDSETLTEIARRSTYCTYPPGETLYRQGEQADSMLLVVNGLIRLSILSSSGREFSLYLASRGDSLGEAALASAGPREADYTAITHSRILKIQRDMLPQSAVVEIAPKLNILLVQRLITLTSIIEELTLHNLESRLARLFCRLEQQQRLPLHQLTQGLIANMANATRPKVNQLLKKMHSAGAIQLHGGQIVAIDRDLLKNLIENSG